MDRKIVTTNRKAFHDYTIVEKYVAGIVLTGTEIKSIRKNAINLKDSFCKIEDNEIFLYKCHISPYEQGNRFNHDAERVRKLLLNRKEILKMHSKVKQDNYTIVPLEVFLSHGFAKVEIGLAKGKKLHDKRDDIAKKDLKRTEHLKLNINTILEYKTLNIPSPIYRPHRFRHLELLEQIHHQLHPNRKYSLVQL